MRIENAFTWDPILEVVYLFAGIFVTILPALAILKAGSAGALAPLVALATGADGQPNNIAYFWLTGLLSSFLDNAPTYLVFFNMAGADPQALGAGESAQRLGPHRFGRIARHLFLMCLRRGNVGFAD